MEKLKTNLQFKVILPVMGILVALSAVVVYSEHHIEFSKLGDQHIADINKTKLLMIEQLHHNAIVYENMTHRICQDTAIQQAFLDGDREGLLELAEARHKDLNSIHNVTHFYFHQLDKTCFLRVHQPSHFGDGIERHTLADAIRQGKPSCGFELGPLGTLAFRYVQPWRVDGKLIGFVELGEEIDSMTRELKKIMGFECVIVVNKSFIDRTDWQEGLQMLGETGNWDLLDDAVIINHTFRKFPDELIGDIQKNFLPRKTGRQTQLVTLNDKKQMVGCFDLTNAGGAQIGRMFVVRDVAVPAALIAQSSVFFGAMIIMAGSCASVFFYFYIGRIERRLKETYEKQQTEIIHRRFAEAQLHEVKERAEAANRAKSQFMANMSHELRTPMNAIMGFSDLLKDELLSEEQFDYIDTINASGRHLLSLINDVLDISKIEAGKEEVALGVCSLRDLLGQLEDLMQNNAQAKGLQFVLDIRADVPEQVITDAKHLYQCLINLVGNAIKFTKTGSVTLRAGLLDGEAGPCLYFEVQDTGIGIPADRQKKVFELFEQVDSSTSRKYGGTGLGLAISKKLIELMGGGLTVESEEGVGSTFTITLPYEPAAQPTAPSVS